MKEIRYTVTNPQGVHARPCALLAQTCMNYSSVVTAAANGKSADGRNVLELLRLAAQKGDILTIEITGEDEEEAHKALETVISKEFKGKNAVDLLKIAFFGTKDYDRTFFSDSNFPHQKWDSHIEKSIL